MTYPDVEALTLTRLAGRPIKLWATDTQNGYPHVTDAVTIQLDCRTQSKADCRYEAWEARDNLLAWQFEPNTPIHSATVVTGPKWLPDEDGAPRYVSLIQIRVRQHRR